MGWFMLEICTTDSLSGTLGILFSALRHQQWVSQESSVCALSCCNSFLRPLSRYGTSRHFARMLLLCCSTCVSNCTETNFLASGWHLCTNGSWFLSTCAHIFNEHKLITNDHRFIKNYGLRSQDVFTHVPRRQIQATEMRSLARLSLLPSSLWEA